MKKIILTIFLYIFFFSFSYADDNELSIIDIDSSNSNLIRIFVDNEIEANSVNLDSDLKLFKDLSIENAIRDLEDDKLIKISLNDDLEKNTSYSLLPIFGVEGNIDFNIEDVINGLEIKGNSLDGINKVLIVDSKHLNVFFEEKIESDKVEIKILKDIGIKSIKLNAENKKEIQVYLNNKLVNKQNYLIMVFSVTNSENKEYSIKNYIYDFTAQVKNADIVNLPREDGLKKEKELNNTALNSAATPDTGPETWILIFLTFILSSFIYIRKKVK